jgi:hypothetical protein
MHASVRSDFVADSPPSDAVFDVGLVAVAQLSTEVATFSWFDVLSAIGGAYALVGT